MVFVKQTSNAVSAKLVNAILFSPTTSFGRPYSLPTASLIYNRELVPIRLSHARVPMLSSSSVSHTCISTFCPSPRVPSIVAVTTTRVSWLTKFRMHRSCGLDSAWISNLRAYESSGRRKSSILSEQNSESSILPGLRSCKEQQPEEQNRTDSRDVVSCACGPFRSFQSSCGDEN